MLNLVRAAVAVIVCAAALAAAAIGAGLQLGRWSDRLDVANQFAPWILLATLGVAAASWFALGGRTRRVALALAAAGVALCGAQVIPELAARAFQPRAKAEGETLKIVQFNVWHRNPTPEKALNWILAQDADIVLVEEAGGRARPIAEGLKSAYPHFASCRKRRPCDETVFSRLPLVARGRVDGPVGYWGDFRWRDRTLTVAVVHFFWPYPAGTQQYQGRELAAFLARRPKRDMILGGDFNAAPWSFSLQRQDRAYGLERRTRGVLTWPARPAHIGERGPEFAPAQLHSPLPILAIDQVYAGEGWRTVRVKRGPRLGSDHYPVVVELAPVSPAERRPPRGR